MTRPTWENFATHDESIVPELWDGVSVALAPCLGPTGSRLHDHSRRANWGVLTNMDNATDWVLSDGQYALDFDGSNDYLLLPQSIALPLPAAISLWFQHTTTSVFILSEPGNASNNAQLLGFSGQIAMGLTNVGAAQITGPVVNDGKWHHLMAVWAATNDRRLYVDGKLAGTSTFDNATNFAVSYFCARSQSSLFYQGKLDDIKVRSIAPNANSVRLEYQLGRGGMYQRRRRRAIYLPQAGFQAAWARGSNVMLGFNQP